VRLLVDTHAILWFVGQDANLSASTRALLVDPANDLILSAASIWEIAVKVNIGKLQLAEPYQDFMDRAIADLELTILPVTVSDCDVLTRLPLHHRDPFDRLMVAQAMVENVSIVSMDAAFDPYPITRLW
jgi:PIN domain nuclease of toxin-antitoxin system